MGTLVLLDLMGGVALLLWGLHMVHSGILRAFGPDLRRLCRNRSATVSRAFAAGLRDSRSSEQHRNRRSWRPHSSADGLMALVPSLAVMLGANVGTTLIVQLLSFNIAVVHARYSFIIGLAAFKRGGGPGTRIKDLGRVAIGLGLLFLALHIFLDTLAPAEEAPTCGRCSARSPAIRSCVLLIAAAADLGGALERSPSCFSSCRSALLAFRLRRGGRSPWCSALISEAPSIRSWKAGQPGYPDELPVCRSET